MTKAFQDEPNGPRWLVLGGTPKSTSSFDNSTIRVVYGALDDYLDDPGGYQGICVREGAGFWRWSRWYLQDLARQLKPGGTLLIEENPFAKRSDFGMLTVIKWGLGLLLWKLSVAAGSVSLQQKLVPGSFLDAVKRWGFLMRPCSGPEDVGITPFSGLCLRKTDDARESALPSDPIHLQRLLRQYFGDWFGEEGGYPGYYQLPVAQPGSLLLDPFGANVLTLSPHPDDELIGCGGTLLGLATAGANIHVLQMTEGMTCFALRDADEATRRGIRWREATAIEKRFDFTGHYWATGPDGGLVDSPNNCERLRSLLRELKPELILIPASSDRHLEHRLANEIFYMACDVLPDAVRVFEYPVWGLLPKPNVAVDVTDRYPQMLDALYLYKTAMKSEDYVSRCCLLAAYHGNLLLGSPERSVEVFFESDLQVHREKGPDRDYRP